VQRWRPGARPQPPLCGAVGTGADLLGATGAGAGSHFAYSEPFRLLSKSASDELLRSGAGGGAGVLAMLRASEPFDTFVNRVVDVPVAIVPGDCHAMALQHHAPREDRAVPRPSPRWAAAGGSQRTSRVNSGERWCSRLRGHLRARPSPAC